MRVIYPLSELSRADLSVAGGKGANLGEMIRLGLPVPPGFVVSTRAYADQARRWGLAERLSAHLAANEDKAAASEAADLFRSGAMLPSIESAIREAYRELGSTKVAVRSSATAEDLAEASFAGQQETYLDVASADEVIASLRSCWASLYSPRALHYRRTKGISHLAVEIAVVVQRMVPAEVAGVLFTVDPVQQRSDWMLLSAAPGLGEAIVSGHRRGDTYRIRREAGKGTPGGLTGRDRRLTIIDRDLESPGRSALSDADLLELGRLGLSLEARFRMPARRGVRRGLRARLPPPVAADHDARRRGARAHRACPEGAPPDGWDRFPSPRSRSITGRSVQPQSLRARDALRGIRRLQGR